MKFFQVNKQVVITIINGDRLDFDCHWLLYQEFSIYMMWNLKYHRWNHRKTSFDKMIEWIYFVDSNDDKRFYLCIFLTIIKNSMLFEDLYIYDDIIHEIFKLTCIMHNLLDFNKQWNHSLTKIEL